MPCVLVDGWISIVGLGDAECWFLWMSAGFGGESYCDNCIPSMQDFDLAVCLVGTAGGVFGACCDDSTGSCTDAVEITDCVGGSLRFAPNQPCAEIDPPCGTILGACCLGGAACGSRYTATVANGCPEDLDGDGTVGIVDFLELLASWGLFDVPADFDGGGVGITDFLALLAAWGPC